MRIKNIIPVTANVITADMVAYIRKYLGAGTQLETVQITEGPFTIESEYDEAIAAPNVLSLCKQAAQEGCDGIFINCFGDPGVRAARECVDIPVFGGVEPAIHLALGLADKVGIVTVLPNVLSLINGSITRAQLQGRVISLTSIDIPVADLQQHDRLCAALLEECKRVIRTCGVQAIVLGCTAMVGVAERVREDLQKDGYDVPVLEAAQAAVMLLELQAKMKLRQSRITYMTPPEHPTV